MNTATAEVSAPNVHRVPCANLPALTAALDKLIRRAAKIGCPLPTYTVGEPYPVEFKRRNAMDEVVKYLVLHADVVVGGPAPKFDGWTLAAVLEPLGEENMVAMVPGVTVTLPASYAVATGACDHCKAHRNRLQTFALAHDDGRTVQVGRQCLRDFLGHESPETLARYAELLVLFGATVSGAEEDDFGGGGGREPDCFALDAYLPWVASSIRADGWCSRTKARDEGGMATSDDAMDRMRRQGYWRDHTPPAPTDGDMAKAAAAIEWAATLDTSAEPVGSYLANVGIVGRAGYTTRKSLGIAASILGAHERATAQVAERAEQRKSVHFGTIGKRETFTFTVLRVLPIETQYGVSYIVLMKDDAGNVAKWKASGGTMAGSDDFDRGVRVTGKCTVKEHTSYKEIAQTVLTRCAFEIVKPAIENTHEMAVAS